MGFGVSTLDTGYGYGLNVAKMLGGPYKEFYSKQLAGGLATVQHAGGFGSNGGDSSNGLACMDSWLGGETFDVITVNFGLHDCESEGRTPYAGNLEAILTKARAASGTTIFITTTPFYKYKTYSYPCVIKYNAMAKQIVAKLNAQPAALANNQTIEVADLFNHIEGYCGTNYTKCPIQLDGNLHFSTAWAPPYSVDSITGKPLQDGPRPSGQQFTGLLVARAIQRALPATKIQPPINASSSGDPPSSLLPLASLDAETLLAPNCGLPPSPLNSSLPNVLIIGDSVSDSGSGYGPDVR
jgi:lysophospholipase L1-like esterase